MALHELAGKPAPLELLVNVPRLVSAYYTGHPDAADVAQQVSFGTSGHRGSSTENSFNEDHILAISQAIADYRKGEGIDGPLFLGMDTHALSEPALASAIEVLAANGPQPGPHQRASRWDCHHPLPQPARRWRLQIQPTQRWPCRHLHHKSCPGPGQRFFG
jgi:hypothetical protein